MKIDQWRLSLISSVICAFYLLFVFVLDLEVFEYFILQLSNIEQYELDELLIPAVLIGVAVIADFSRHKYKVQQHIDHIQLCKQTSEESRQIIIAFLKQMELFRLEAERSPYFDRTLIDNYTKICRDTNVRIEKIGAALTEIKKQK